jgi:hypothetical protein
MNFQTHGIMCAYEFNRRGFAIGILYFREFVALNAIHGPILSLKKEIIIFIDL